MTDTMLIPFVDLKAQYLSIRSEIDRAIQQVIDETAFIGGQAIRDFEKKFAAYIGLDHCIACGNGTDSLEILLKVLGVREGDEVIVPALSWISTSEAVSNIGAMPVFVDIDKYFTINTALIRAKISPRTKAIIPVHLYGQPADMPAIMKIAEEFGLKVIEDCAQSHGATIENKITGTWGHASSFSFYPGKNLGAYGDAGAMLTNDAGIAAMVRQIANHGQQKKHEHLLEGRNSRMDTLQAAILNAKLPYLQEWTESRIRNATVYDQQLENSAAITPVVRPNAKHVYHLYVIRALNRDKLKQYLEKKGISTSIHYPMALPFLPCYNKKNYKFSDFPVASTTQQEILSLPMYAELTRKQIEYISDQINEFFKTIE